MKPGATTFACNAPRPQLTGQGACHPHQTRLRSRVIHLSGRTHHADHRGDEHDPSELSADHRSRGPPRHSKSTAEIGRNDPIPVLIRHSHEQGVPGDSGVRDEHLDGSEARLDLRERCLHLSRIGHIALHTEYIGGHIAAAVRGSDSMPGLCQPSSNSVANSFAAAGHQDNARWSHGGHAIECSRSSGSRRRLTW
jgi:hypothetical protein